jgi:hypothetical protein
MQQPQVTIQHSQCQALLPTKLAAVQTTAFILAHDLLNLDRGAPSLPNHALFICHGPHFNTELAPCLECGCCDAYAAVSTSAPKSATSARNTAAGCGSSRMQLATHDRSMHESFKSPRVGTTAGAWGENSGLVWLVWFGHRRALALHSAVSVSQGFSPCGA